MKKGLYPIVILSIILIFSYCENATERPPNIIYILADDLGYGDIGAFNSEGKIKTPQLDLMAQQGMVFTDAHTTSSVCTPTRYGILTGRYNWRSPLKKGVLSGTSSGLIPKYRTTVASFLKSQGYQTAFIGKWHLGWNWALKDSSFINSNIKNDEIFEKIDFTKNISHRKTGGSIPLQPLVFFP